MEASKYQHGKIYKITDNGYTKCYIGSTCEGLARRMAKHRHAYKAKGDGKKYTSTTTIQLFDEFGMENCKIELLEEYPCESKEQLMQREGYHIKNTDCLNKKVMGRSSKEYYFENKDGILVKRHQYYLENKDDILEQNKQYNAENKEKITEYKQKYYSEHKETLAVQMQNYRSNNKDKLSEYFKEHYLEHKENKLDYARQYRSENKTRIREQANIKHECSVCGGKYSNTNKARHETSNRHQLALKQET